MTIDSSLHNVVENMLKVFGKLNLFSRDTWYNYKEDGSQTVME